MSRIWNKNHEKKSTRSSLSFTIFASLPFSPRKWARHARHPLWPGLFTMIAQLPIEAQLARGKMGWGLWTLLLMGGKQQHHWNEPIFISSSWLVFVSNNGVKVSYKAETILSWVHTGVSKCDMMYDDFIWNSFIWRILFLCHLGFILEFSAVGIGQLRRVAFVSSTWKLAYLTKSTSPVPHCNQGPAGRCFLDLGGFGSGVEKKSRPAGGFGSGRSFERYLIYSRTCRVFRLYLIFLVYPKCRVYPTII